MFKWLFSRTQTAAPEPTGQPASGALPLTSCSTPSDSRGTKRKPTSNEPFQDASARAGVEEQGRSVRRRASAEDGSSEYLATCTSAAAHEPAPPQPALPPAVQDASAQSASKAEAVWGGEEWQQGLRVVLQQQQGGLCVGGQRPAVGLLPRDLAALACTSREVAGCLGEADWRAAVERYCESAAGCHRLHTASLARRVAAGGASWREISRRMWTLQEVGLRLVEARPHGGCGEGARPGPRDMHCAAALPGLGLALFGGLGTGTGATQHRREVLADTWLLSHHPAAAEGGWQWHRMEARRGQGSSGEAGAGQDAAARTEAAPREPPQAPPHALAAAPRAAPAGSEAGRAAPPEGATARPPGRMRGAMVDVELPGGAVAALLCGGIAAGVGVYLNDTWILEQADPQDRSGPAPQLVWRKVLCDVQPPPVFGHAICHSRQRVVVCGGWEQEGRQRASMTNAVWELNLALLQPAPAVGDGPAAYLHPGWVRLEPVGLPPAPRGACSLTALGSPYGGSRAASGGAGAGGWRMEAVLFGGVFGTWGRRTFVSDAYLLCLRAPSPTAPSSAIWRKIALHPPGPLPARLPRHAPAVPGPVGEGTGTGRGDEHGAAGAGPADAPEPHRTGSPARQAPVLSPAAASGRGRARAVGHGPALPPRAGHCCAAAGRHVLIFAGLDPGAPPSPAAPGWNSGAAAASGSSSAGPARQQRGPAGGAGAAWGAPDRAAPGLYQRIMAALEPLRPASARAYLSGGPRVRGHVGAGRGQAGGEGEGPGRAAVRARFTTSRDVWLLHVPHWQAPAAPPAGGAGLSPSSASVEYGEAEERYEDCPVVPATCRALTVATASGVVPARVDHCMGQALVADEQGWGFLTHGGLNEVDQQNGEVYMLDLVGPVRAAPPTL